LLIVVDVRVGEGGMVPVCVSEWVGLGFRPRETARFGGGQHAD
jgi:hypothetical protein